MAVTKRRPGTRSGPMGQDFIEEGPGGFEGPAAPPPGPTSPAPPGDDGLFWDGAPSRQGMTPRENPTLRAPSGAGAAPPMPKSPSPQAGSVSTAGMGSTEGVMPFAPMGGTPNVRLAKPSSQGLYGSLGGLQGGGLGLPLDPTSNQQSDPISTLIQMLSGRSNKQGLG